MRIVALLLFLCIVSAFQRSCSDNGTYFEKKIDVRAGKGGYVIIPGCKYDADIIAVENNQTVTKHISWINYNSITSSAKLINTAFGAIIFATFFVGIVAIY